MLENLKEFSVVYETLEGVPMSEAKDKIQWLFDPEGLRGWKQKGIPNVKVTPDGDTIVDNLDWLLP